MLKNDIEQLRKKLNQLIEEEANHEKILEASVELDKLIETYLEKTNR